MVLSLLISAPCGLPTEETEAVVIRLLLFCSEVFSILLSQISIARLTEAESYKSTRSTVADDYF